VRGKLTALPESNANMTIVSDRDCVSARSMRSRRLVLATVVRDHRERRCVTPPVIQLGQPPRIFPLNWASNQGELEVILLRHIVRVVELKLG